MSHQVFAALKERMLGIASKRHEAISEFDPDYIKAVINFYFDHSVDRPGSVLPRKTKELIIMCVSATKASESGISNHMRRALLCGATPREVLEALQAAAIPGGLLTMWRGAEVLAEVLKAENRKFE